MYYVLRLLNNFIGWDYSLLPCPKMEDLLPSVHLLLLKSVGRTAQPPGRDPHPCSRVRDPRKVSKYL